MLPLIILVGSSSSLNIEEALSSSVETDINFLSVENTWDIFSKNGEAIKQDFELLTRDKTSQALTNYDCILILGTIGAGKSTVIH
jgi:hypothetical protein